MKRIDKDCLHGGAGRMLAEGLKTTVTNRAGTPVIRKTLCLPVNVHAIASEVAFRSEITLKKLLVNALTEMLNGDLTECRSYDYAICVHPSVLLPRDVYQQVRNKAHYGKTAERTLITESLVRYLKNHYQGRYSDIPGIQDM